MACVLGLQPAALHGAAAGVRARFLRAALARAAPGADRGRVAEPVSQRGRGAHGRHGASALALGVGGGTARAALRGEPPRRHTTAARLQRRYVREQLWRGRALWPRALRRCQTGTRRVAHAASATARQDVAGAVVGLPHTCRSHGTSPHRHSQHWPCNMDRSRLPFALGARLPPPPAGVPRERPHRVAAAARDARARLRRSAGVGRRRRKSRLCSTVARC